jgi:ammonia channel protein AmtB
MYQLTFAMITPALICGSFADRMKYGPMLLFMALWHLLVYCPIAHAIWHPDGKDECSRLWLGLGFDVINSHSVSWILSYMTLRWYALCVSFYDSQVGDLYSRLFIHSLIVSRLQSIHHV